jgi:hypothetical protein
MMSDGHDDNDNGHDDNGKDKMVMMIKYRKMVNNKSSIHSLLLSPTVTNTVTLGASFASR